MSKNNNIIKINGRQYDALTGEVIGERRLATAVPVVEAAAVAPAKSISAPVKKPAHTAKKPVHHLAPTVTAHHPQTAQTLMRHTVHKPAAGSLAGTSRSAKQLHRQTAAAVVAKPSIKKVDAQRLRRAQSIQPSKLVSRFSKQTASSYIAPTVERATSATSDLVSSLAAPLSAADQLIDKALREATSHLQPAHHPTKRHRRLRSPSAAIAAFVLLAGFIGYQNIANIKLHMAASHAGFAAQLPGYRPAGFSLGRFSYSPGNVAIHFHSNSDDRTFAVTEQPSSWDNQALANHLDGAHSYQAVQQGSQTIYIDEQGNATWVNNHVWYQVQNNGALSDRQLGELAGSV